MGVRRLHFPHGDAFDVVNVSYRVLITDRDLVSFTTVPDVWRRCCFEQGYCQMRTTTAPQFALRCAAYSEEVQALTTMVAKPTSGEAIHPARDCIAGLVHGLPVSAVAHTLGVSERTVAFHLANARPKICARTREAQLVKVWRVS